VPEVTRYQYAAGCPWLQISCPRWHFLTTAIEASFSNRFGWYARAGAEWLALFSPCGGFVLALRGLPPGGVGDDDAAGGFFLGIDTLDADAIVKWAELHAFLHVHHWILPKAINEVGEQKIEFKISHQKFIAARPG
jgi:hypothetical protein